MKLVWSNLIEWKFVLNDDKPCNDKPLMASRNAYEQWSQKYNAALWEQPAFNQILMRICWTPQQPLIAVARKICQNNRGADHKVFIKN